MQAQFRWRYQCPHHKCIYEWIKKFRTHGTISVLRATEKPIQDDLRLQGHRRTLQLQEIRLSAVQASHCVAEAKSLALIGSLWEGFSSQIYTCTPTKYRLSISLPQMTWESVSPCASGCVAKLMRIQVFWDNVWFSDEAHFLLSGHVNSKNNIFWGIAPPKHCLQRPLLSTICTAWVALSKHGIIGPYWFEDDDEHGMTVNTALGRASDCF